ncbi:cupin domain-containing protein [Actinoplanes sp. NPDC049265]|uniref:AraC family transcriptional regulator n=1 Tax=Actinoplanes sp. NPDC049265 TaxID=3363902 RepID=UPI003717411B
MDVLSDAIAAMRAGRPRVSLTETADPSWTAKFDTFPGARFHVVVTGRCAVTGVGALGPGDAVLLPRGTAHVLENAGDGGLQLLCGGCELDQNRVHPIVRDFPDVVILPARDGGLQATIGLLRGEVIEPSPGTDVVVPALLEVLFVHLIRAWCAEQARWRTSGWCVALADPVIARALRAMHEHPAEPWTVASLGAEAGLSRAAFARRFTTMVGQPPLTYLLWWRLTTAARLLRTTDAPLATVARRTGYGSPYAFAAAFKREYGIPAGRYRHDHRATVPSHHPDPQW